MAGLVFDKSIKQEGGLGESGIGGIPSLPNELQLFTQVIYENKIKEKNLIIFFYCIMEIML